MVEEIKEQEQKPEGKKVAIFFKLILGMVFLVLGILAVWFWWKDLLTILRGGIGPFLLLAALITFVIAKE